MMRGKRLAAILRLGAVVAVLLVMGGCAAAPPLPGRFTYILKYEVTAECSDPLQPPTALSVEYREDPDLLVPLTPATNLDPPWSVELAMDYDYNNPFAPELRLNSATFTNVGDSLLLKIIWKDYKVDFQEEILESRELVYTGAAPDPVTLIATDLPK
jgi:hypothetical protein